MLHFKLCKIRLSKKREKVLVGKVFEDGKKVSNIVFQKSDGHFFIVTAFVSSVINWGHPEKPVDEVAVSEERKSVCRFIFRYQGLFSRASSVA